MDNLFFWRKSPKERLTNKIDSYYQKERNRQFDDVNNRKWIENGLLREMSRIVAGEKSRIKAGLEVDTGYHRAVEILLDQNQYYDLLAPLDELESEDQAGEILCKTPLQFSGYYKNEKLTKKTISNGYFLTGDIGYLDNEGYLILTGRKRDIIITGGINVHASDIEKVLNLHPKISESAVIGLKDKRLGEAIFAIIIPNSKEDFKKYYYLRWKT